MDPITAKLGPDAQALADSLKTDYDACQYESDKKRARRYVLVDSDGGLSPVDQNGRASQTSTVTLRSARFHTQANGRRIYDAIAGTFV